MKKDERLNEDEIYKSFEAVRRFLIDGKKCINGGNVHCYFIEERGESEAIINVGLKGSSYVLDYDIFKSYDELRNPIWSEFKLLKWDEINRELVIDIDHNRKIKLKRINR